MKNIVSVFALIATLGTATGCVLDPDPGVCWTSGEFDRAWVERNSLLTAEAYVRDVCMDWVELLYNNCVDIYGLPLFPSYSQVAEFCNDRMVRDGDMITYQFEHACNFERNPSIECRLYGASEEFSGSEPVSSDAVMSHEDVIRAMSSQIRSSESLSSSLPATTITLGNGEEISAAKLFN